VAIAVAGVLAEAVTMARSIRRAISHGIFE
jgi:hypothetical protein